LKIESGEVEKMKSYRYINFENRQEQDEPSSFFMLNCFLRSRIHLGLESNETVFDEDVNIYIANLLDRLTYQPEVYQHDDRISKHDSDIALLVSAASNNRESFEVYRQNADYLLLKLGLFSGDFDKPPRPKRFWEQELGFYEKRARAYYRFAASYAERAFGNYSALAGIMEKISNDFAKYLLLIRHLKIEYMNFHRKFSPGEFYHMTKQLDADVILQTPEYLRNQFLDLYSKWMKTGKKSLKQEINAAAERVRQVDPDFSFQDLK